MEKIRNFELQFRCGQDPKSFKPAADGQFCPHCSKTVYDFSDKSLDDLLEFFEKRGSSFCGSFAPEQLTRSVVEQVVLGSIAPDHRADFSGS